ncbi:MAG: glycoside hydrolase family 88 protein [Muribaculaceae bacterium]|nr:glycoside hydrolase family 88 protein [Muribaculaceae bacterium]
MKKVMLAVAAVAVMAACNDGKVKNWDEMAVEKARIQMGLQIDTVESLGFPFHNPTSLQDDGSVLYCDVTDWRSGFFPGAVWYLYELTGDTALVQYARRYTEYVAEAQYLKWHHDVGFMVGSSFGNGYRLTGDSAYAEAVVEAARSLSTRFRPTAGIIQSWDVEPGSEREAKGWACPVIIDNMMNLELMFEATKLSGDSSFYNLAVSHADRTLREHFRPDGSCFHVIDYDTISGDVRHRHTAQGCAHSSAWSRGQAWAIYGYTVAYRETGKPEYLERAMGTFDFVKKHPNMPADKIPYWDFDAPGIPDEPRDASAAAVIASALYELSIHPVGERSVEYVAYADSIMQSLSSDGYTAPVGENGRFILMHSVTSLPAGVEIDVPLNYADYYYLEALKRRRDLVGVNR